MVEESVRFAPSQAVRRRRRARVLELKISFMLTFNLRREMVHRSVVEVLSPPK